MFNRGNKIIFWFLALISAFIPVIVNVKIHSSFEWTIGIIFPMLMIVMYPSWKFGLTAMVMASSIKYFTELLLDPDTIYNELPRLVSNSIAHWLIFLLIAFLRINYHKTAQKLNESEERYRSLIEYNFNMIYSMDLNECFTEGNSIVKQVTGYSMDELNGKSFASLIVPDYLESTKENFRKTVQGESQRYECAIYDKEGRIIPLMVTNVPIIVNNEIVGVYGTAMDLTDIKNAEIALKESEERYKKIVEFLPKGVVIHRDNFILYTNPSALKIMKEVDAVGRPIADYVHPKYHKIYKERIAQTTEEQQQLPTIEFELIRTDGEVVDIEVNSISINYDGETAILTLIKDITESKKMERTLKESLKNLADLKMALDESSIIAITDPKGIIQTVNDKFCEISQYTQEELIGQDHRILNSGYHSKEFFKDMWKTIVNGNTWRGEVKNRAKDGSFYWVHTTIVPFLNEKGEPFQYIAIRTDITERKQAEEALVQSEERYRKLVELSPEPITVHTDGIIKYVNKAGIKVLGIDSPNELIGKNVITLIHPDYRQAVAERMKTLKNEGNTVELMEEKIIRFDGSIIDVEVAGVGVIYEGKLSIQLTLRDITARKQAEELLRKSEEKYRLIAENMTDLLSVVDTNGQMTYISPSHEKILGYPISYYENNSGFNFIHFDDLPKIESNFQLMLETKQGNMIECRFRHKNGNWIWFESTCSPILDDNGNILHFVVVSRKISERKMYEEKLTHMAFHDTLTGLPNRRLFTDRLEQAIKEAERYERNMAVMYMDMDKFKHINDTLGHDVGDELLKQFSQRVKGCLRESDTLARQGGDEFTILLSEIQEEQDASDIANRILDSLQEAWNIGEHVFHITSSIGIAFYPSDGINRHDLVKHADRALYEAKESGRNNYKTYSAIE